MNLELTDEQVALRDTVRSFLAEKASIAGHVRPLLDDATGTTEAVWRGLVDLGTTGLLVPTEYDGAGMTMVEAGIVFEELGAGLHPGPWLSSAVAATRAIMRFGVDSSAAAPLFTGIANGSTIATVGPLEGARPSVVELGDGIALRGEIDSVWDVAAADLILVLADDRRRHRSFRGPDFDARRRHHTANRNRPDPQAVPRQVRRHARATSRHRIAGCRRGADRRRGHRLGG